MYHQHFGLNEAPFSIAVNPRYLFMSQRHRDALAHLLYGVSGGSGFILLTGEVGTGKTTVNRCLLEQLPETTDLAIILNPALSAAELLATACDELRIDYPQGTESLKALTDALHRYLLDNHAKRRKTVLMIDEAQHLDFNVLEQIRLLTNLETNDEKLLQIILIGQPELTEKLSRPELRQLNQRITARYNLQPLNLQETTAYIKHRLEIAGLRGGTSLFEAAAVKLIHRLTRGIPRLINVLCDRALLGAYGQQRGRVNKKLIAEAASEVFGEQVGAAYFISDIRNRAVLVLTIAVMSAAAGYFLSQRVESGADNKVVGSNEVSSDVSIVSALALSSPPSKAAEGPLESTQLNAAKPDLTFSQPTLIPDAITGKLSSAELSSGIITIGDSSSLVGSTQRLASSSAGPLWELSVQEANEVFWQAASNTPVPSTVCPPPKITGLNCTIQSVQVWNDLMSLNRPVLLDIVTKDRFAAAAFVLAFREASALAWTKQGVVEVPLAELAGGWTGGARYLWQAPRGWRGSVALGNTSSAVNVIAQMFATLDDMAAPTVISFGPALEARVRLFQETEGIIADGVVGEQTLLRLNDRLGIGLTSERALERSSMWIVKASQASGYKRDLR